MHELIASEFGNKACSRPLQPFTKPWRIKRKTFLKKYEYFLNCLPL